MFCALGWVFRIDKRENKNFNKTIFVLKELIRWDNPEKAETS